MKVGEGAHGNGSYRTLSRLGFYSERNGEPVENFGQVTCDVYLVFKIMITLTTCMQDASGKAS